MTEIPSSCPKIEQVDPDSAAVQAGIQAGDRILSLNGQPLRDVIDYQYQLEETNQLEVEREGRRVAVHMDVSAGADPGISFSSAVFDRVRVCRSRCVFCFVDQLPRSLRRPLYLKDDDYRLSFLYGNFITLGNLGDDDIKRILDQRLSPLYVSVHATDPELRARMMGMSVADAARGLGILRRLGESGIATHIQIVFCPGINDGPVLERTVMELAEAYPGVASVGIVPVAVSAELPGRRVHLQNLENSHPLRPLTPADAEAVLESVTAWQKRFRREQGSGFVYAADEFYLSAGWSLPPLEAYDDFPHYENGIGIAASFLAEAGGVVGQLLDRHQPGGTVFLLTGKLAAGLVGDVAANLMKSLGIVIKPLVAGNRTFGAHVTVTGLLGGKDILEAARGAGLGPDDLLLVPRCCVSDAPSPLFLDDMTLDGLKAGLGCEVKIV